TDAIMGTPAYISPEQAQGLSVDQRSDIYSLGIILYEMVTGRVPFVADTPLAVLFKHISDPLPLPSLVKTDIPASIEQVILKALAKDPQDRFTTTAEFVAAWKRALEERETVHRVPEMTSASASHAAASDHTQRKPAPTGRTVSRSGKPTAWVVGCLAGACLLLSVAGVFLLALNWRNLSPTNPATDTPLPPQTVAPISKNNVLLEDDFSTRKSDWGTLTDADSSVDYENGALRILLFKENFVVWTTPNDQDYQNIHIEVTAINNDTDPTTAFGIICAQQVEDWSFYYFAITPTGEYAIIRATTEKPDIFLTNNGQWASSDLIAQKAPSYRLGADCGNGTLKLYVDGQQIASASDSTYTTGHIGLFTWSGKNAPTADMTFDDFLMTSLE
ncbi:MAG: serine/threonine protein kinase, partial [Chloroflexi bacterium]